MLFTIRKGKDTTAVISTVGAEMHSFRCEDVSYIWEGNPRYWAEHAPILFPVVCTPKDGKLAQDGVEYPMPKHGFLKNMEFQPVLQTPDRVAMEVCETEKTVSMFPYRFLMRVEYAVTEKGFSASFTVSNRDKKPMTYCIGGHPGFRCPIFPGDTFSSYRLEFENAAGAYVTGTDHGLMRPDLPHLQKLCGNTLPLSYPVFENDTLIFQDLPCSRVRLVSENTGGGIVFDFTGFSALGLWTVATETEHAPFLCMEPWNGLPASSAETTDAKSKKYAKTLQPGESHTVGYRVTVL